MVSTRILCCVTICAAIFAPACSDDTTVSGPICVQYRAQGDSPLEIDCEISDVETSLADGGAGDNGGSAQIVDPCHWAYNPSKPSYGECVPLFVHGKELVEIAVLIEPGSTAGPPSGLLPEIALIRKAFYPADASPKTLGQKQDQVATVQDWSSPHWIRLKLHETIALDQFEYRVIFEPHKQQGLGEILSTEATFQ